MSQLIESMSGTRGIVGDTLTPEVALEIGLAFGTFCKNGPIIVGGDTRTSHDSLKASVISGLTAVGCDVIDINRVPTPTVQQAIQFHNAKGGIVITASHNPVIWNGLKLMNENGAFLTDTEFETYTTIRKNKTYAYKNWNEIGQLSQDYAALEKHVDKILSLIDTSQIKAANLNVLVDANNGAGCPADPILLDKLGVRYTILNKDGNGRFSHNPEPLKENLSEIIDTLKNGNYDIGFVQDADADRLVILDETGHFIGEDYSLTFCMDEVLHHLDPNSDKTVVVNLSTSNVITWLAEKYNAKLIQTKIGESNVTQAIKSEAAQVGGEGNGGIIYPTVGWGRDSLVGIVLALNHLARKKQSVSEIVKDYPKFVMLRDKATVANRDAVKPYLEAVKAAFPEASFNTEDGVKAILDNAWVHVRPSNTEPIVRIFIEAESMEKATALREKLA